MYLAVGLHPGESAPDATEEIAVRWATLAEIRAEIARREIHDLMTIAAIYRYELELAGT
jgi:hypothetical protein